MAIGTVTLLGASEIIVSGEAPRAPAISTAAPMATVPPAKRPQVRGSHILAKRRRCSYKGTANATVAGPKRKLMCCPPLM